MRQTDAGVEYHFGAARNPSFALGLTRFNAPAFVPLLTGRFEWLLLAIGVDLWLGTTDVTCDRIRPDAV